jgi:UDP-N-acetylglucosamine 2-epimerase (non-hydrolysing)
MLAIVYGTLPEWNKIKPLVKELQEQQIDFRLICVRQHTTLIPKEAWCHWSIDVNDYPNTDRLNSVVSSILVSDVFKDKEIDSVLVQGDTATVFAVALKAFHEKKKIIHLESGLRCFTTDENGNRINVQLDVKDERVPFPEEGYRTLVSEIADYNLCPTHFSYFILSKPNKSTTVGNTVIDNLLHLTPENSNEVIITLHRRENKNLIEKYLHNINELAKVRKDLKFTVLTHPNWSRPNEYYEMNFKHLTFQDRIQPNDYIQRLAKCHSIITDSGGGVEESYHLRKPCVVCRACSERSEVFNVNSILCKEPNDIRRAFDKAQKLDMNYKNTIFGFGDASKRTVEALKNWGIVK